MPLDTVSSRQMESQVSCIVQYPCYFQHAILAAAIEQEVPGSGDPFTGNMIAAERQMIDSRVGNHDLRLLLGAGAVGIDRYVA